MATKPKPKGKAAPAAKPAKTQAKAPEAEKRENRYLRAARIIIEAGEGLDLAELARRIHDEGGFRVAEVA